MVAVFRQLLKLTVIYLWMESGYHGSCKRDVENKKISRMSGREYPVYSALCWREVEVNVAENATNNGVIKNTNNKIN